MEEKKIIQNQYIFHPVDDLDFFRKLALATAQVARKYEASITIYSLCRHTIFNDDIVCEAFIKALPDDIESKLVQHTGDPYITLSSMNQSTHIVSVRLHGSIFSYINQRNPYKNHKNHENLRNP